MTTPDVFYPDAYESELQKQRRERHFHAIELPRLRLVGLSIMSLLVVLRQAFVPDEPSSRPLLLGTIVVIYSLVSRPTRPSGARSRSRISRSGCTRFSCWS